MLVVMHLLNLVGLPLHLVDLQLKVLLAHGVGQPIEPCAVEVLFVESSPPRSQDVFPTHGCGSRSASCWAQD